MTATSGHTVVVGNDGPKAAAQTPAPAEEPPKGLSRGDYGTAVETMQRLLLKWDPACLPKCGADGDFGSETQRAVRDFQATHDLPATGVYDETTRDLLTGMYGDTKPADDNKMPAQQVVEVTGGTVNVRSAPGTTGRKLGVTKIGDRLEYQGESRDVNGTPWHLVIFRNQNAWISGKFSRVVSA